MNRPPDIVPALWARVEQLSPTGRAIEEFGWFLDTHRDLPHIGTFDNDLHRGTCHPVLVRYDPVTDVMETQLQPGGGTPAWLGLQRHQKHQFIDPVWFSQFLIDEMMAGREPLDSDGRMETSHLREARLKIYHIWSFRQVVMEHYRKMGLRP